VTSSGAILIADDDDTFRQATVELLRREGYACEGAADGPSAAEKLRVNHYDLLIADIRMPGNGDLELVREVPRLAEGTPVILVTAYPSLDSAIDAIHLPVAAYLTKPFGLEELRSHVRAAMQRSGALRGMTCILRGLKVAVEDCGHLQSRLDESREAVSQEELGRALNSVVRTLAECLGEGRCLLRACAPALDTSDLCLLVSCQRRGILQRALTDAIEVVERSKKAFKSKELAELRLRLERALEAAEKTA
jgi:DNA-binding response OmpR family regulator